MKLKNSKSSQYNEELNRLIKGKDIVKFIKAHRIRWLGHVKRMEAGAMPRRTMEGRPRLRWMDDDVADLRAMKIKTVDREGGG
jgi:hypothetical protein